MSSKEIEISLGPDGIVLNDGIHDSEIVKIRIEGDADCEKIAVIDCQSEDGKCFSFTLKDTDFFKVDYYSHQNVIMEILIITKNDPEKYIRNIESLNAFYSERLNTIIEEIKRGDLIFFNIVPATGCEVIGVCKGVECREL